MGDLTILLMAGSVIILSWTVSRLDYKVDKHIRKFKKFEEALKKNATGGIKTGANYRDQYQDIYR